jgi:phi13 family phage major tail protein
LPWVNVLNLMYAKVIKDDASGTTYDTPKKIAEMISAEINPTTNSATNYADGGPTDVATALGPIQMTLQVRDLPLEVQADLLGHTLGQDGILRKNKNDKAPYVAIGFKVELATDGSTPKYGYKWYLKGMFVPQQENFQTRTEQPAFQNPQITATFIPRLSDGYWQFEARDDQEGFTGADQWFSKVWDPNASGS